MRCCTMGQLGRSSPGERSARTTRRTNLRLMPWLWVAAGTSSPCKLLSSSLNRLRRFSFWVSRDRRSLGVGYRER